MTYLAGEARRELLDTVAAAIAHLAAALADLGAAYELLDERAADRLEDELFGPVQHAYGRARRTHTGFAGRAGLAEETFPAAAGEGPAGGTTARELLQRAMEGVARADMTLSALQDSMAPVEVGDPELRRGLAEVRELLGPLPGRAREFVRVLGR
ncbi:MAG TPA: hypothetical protein VD931_05755 [Baekduia sp.]|nr:hypothetical protein [Baekduia sp.]